MLGTMLDPHEGYHEDDSIHRNRDREISLQSYALGQMYLLRSPGLYVTVACRWPNQVWAESSMQFAAIRFRTCPLPHCISCLSMSLYLNIH